MKMLYKKNIKEDNKKKYKIYSKIEKNNKCNDILYDNFEKQMNLLNRKIKKIEKIKTSHFYGIVTYGTQQMQKIGFPTANIEIQSEINKNFIKNGFFTSITEIDGNLYKSISLLGRKNDILETYIINFNQNIYGKKINVKLTKFIFPIKDPEKKNIKNNFELIDDNIVYKNFLKKSFKECEIFINFQQEKK